jgi:hypothetical protein
VVLYGCETWFLTFREEHRLRLFENRVLRRIFGPKRYEVTGGWRKLHKEELSDLYCSPSISRMIKSRWMMRWARNVTRICEKRNSCRLLVGKTDGRRQLGRPRRRWVDNIKMDLAGGGVDWIGLTQDRDKRRALMNAVMNILVQKMQRNYRVTSQLMRTRVVLSSIRIVRNQSFSGIRLLSEQVLY